MTGEKKSYVLKTSNGNEIQLELDSISKHGKVVLKKVNETDTSDSGSTSSDSDSEEEKLEELQKEEELRMYQAELDLQLVILFFMAIVFGVVAYLFFPLEQIWHEMNAQ